jgi:aerobic-type carbon monoxide dehydrogenase small subunit (CoxS/CutS family)
MSIPGSATEIWRVPKIIYSKATINGRIHLTVNGVDHKLLAERRERGYCAIVNNGDEDRRESECERTVWDSSHPIACITRADGNDLTIRGGLLNTKSTKDTRRKEELHPLQEAFILHGNVYCIPGQI